MIAAVSVLPYNLPEATETCYSSSVDAVRLCFRPEGTLPGDNGKSLVRPRRTRNLDFPIFDTHSSRRPEEPERY